MTENDLGHNDPKRDDLERAGLERRSAAEEFGLPSDLFPITGRIIEVAGARVHHLDEGDGPVVLLVHGNPTWSFLYRHVIGGLAEQYRCIAVDLPGFGLSEPPSGYGYTPAEHAQVLAAFVEALDLRGACLVAHDWGGPIGLRAMLDTGGRIERVVLGNTWAWPVNGDWHFEWFSRLMGRRFGRWANERHAVFVEQVLPRSMRRGRPSAEVMDAYRAPFLAPRSRAPLHTFPRHILASRGWLADLEQAMASWDGPIGFVWPDGDIAFREAELARWRRMFPDAPVRRIEQCGHFLWEDAPAETIDALTELLHG